MNRKFLVNAITICIMVVLTARVSTANPLLPLLDANMPSSWRSVAGESRIHRAEHPFEVPVYVDWMVFSPHNWSADSAWHIQGALNTNDFLYVYQLENTSTDMLKSMSIDTPYGTSNAGWINNKDMDDYFSHRYPYYANLDTEHELANAGISDVDYVNSSGSTAQWAFSLPAGMESEVMWFTSSRAPGYDDIRIMNSDVAWQSPDKVPSPTPEPATLLLLGSIVAGFFVDKKRTQN